MTESNWVLRTEQLSKIEIFKDLTLPELERLLSILTIESYKAGEAIFEEHTSGDAMYMVTHGDVCIEKHTLSGEPYTCDYLREEFHCFFGEFSLLDSGMRSATVRAVTDVEALVIHRAAFDTFCADNVSTGFKIMKAIAMRLISRLRKADDEMMILFQALVEEIGKA